MNEAVTSETLENLETKVARCEPCQKVVNTPSRFKVSMDAENVRFNSRVCIDIMYIDGKPVLHLVDDATHFSAAPFLSKVSTEAMWESILTCWATVYTGLPHKFITDQGSQSQETFAKMAELHGVKVCQTGIQSHNSLGIGERYHAPLRNTFRKLCIEYPRLRDELLLALSTNAINDTLGPEGVVPSELVYGEFPSLRSYLGAKVPRETLAERAIVAQKARKIMSKELASAKIKLALKR